MDNGLHELAMREKGALSISIGTSLAIEGALGIYPERPETPAPILGYESVWLNLWTLIRNALQALGATEQLSVLPNELALAVMEDIEGIKDAIRSRYEDKVEVIVYCLDYNYLKRAFSHAEFKVPSTDLQITRSHLEKHTKDYFIKHMDSPVRTFPAALAGSFPTALIVTHFAVDLLARYSFSMGKLALLESHTGKIKNPPQWNSKLGINGPKEHIPFNKFTLQVFGDGAVQFKAAPMPLRKAILKMAEEKNWTPMTTLDRIRQNIKDSRDGQLIIIANQYL